MPDQIKFVYINSENAYFQRGEEKIDIAFNMQDRGYGYSNSGSPARAGHLKVSFTTKNGEAFDILSLYDHTALQNIESWCKMAFRMEGDSRYIGETSLDDLFDRAVRDKTGVRIDAGDFIVYAVASNSSASLKYGLVIGVKARLDNEGNQRLSVLGENFYNWRAEEDKGVAGKVVSLSHLANVIKIPPTSVPPKLMVSFNKAVQTRRNK